MTGLLMNKEVAKYPAIEMTDIERLRIWGYKMNRKINIDLEKRSEKFIRNIW